MSIKEIKEELIAKIIIILNELGTTEFYWSDLNLGWSPILQEDKFNSDNTYGLDSIEADGVNGSNFWFDGFWSWDELDVETIEIIYNHLLEYDPEEKKIMKDIKHCPYCGSENFEWVGDAFDKDNETPYHCHECNQFFNIAY